MLTHTILRSTDGVIFQIVNRKNQRTRITPHMEYRVLYTPRHPSKRESDYLRPGSESPSTKTASLENRSGSWQRDGDDLVQQSSPLFPTSPVQYTRMLCPLCYCATRSTKFMSNALAAIKPQHRVYSVQSQTLALVLVSFPPGERFIWVVWMEYSSGSTDTDRTLSVCFPSLFFFSWVGQTHGGGGWD